MNTEKSEKIEKIPAAIFLHCALGHMENRAETYDKPEGERSMLPTVRAFNAITGKDLTEEQGWLFMALLKATRSQQGAFKPDNYEDGSAYFALAGECASIERAERQRQQFTTLGAVSRAFASMQNVISKVKAATARQVTAINTVGESQP